jgi:hypothetical protein
LCWGGLESGTVKLPADWFPDGCDSAIQKVLRFEGSEEETSDKEGKVEEENSSPEKCVIRPSFTLHSSDIRIATESEIDADGNSYAVQFSTKYRNNAYVEIISALFANDRSYFTTTEVIYYKIQRSLFINGYVLCCRNYMHSGLFGMEF